MPYGGVALGVGDLDLVDVDQRLEQLLLGQLPDVAGIGRHLALEVVDVVGHEGAEELVLHRIELAAEAGAAAGAPEHAADVRMLRQEILDRIADRKALLVVAGRRRGAGVGIFARLAPRPLARPGGHRVRAGVAGEELGIDLRIPLLQPRLRLRGIGELSRDPGCRLVDARSSICWPFVRFFRSASASSFDWPVIS